MSTTRKPSAGIELHFLDYQFGRGLPVIIVTWDRVADLVAPIMGCPAAPPVA